MGYIMAVWRVIKGKRWSVHCWADPREVDPASSGASCLLLVHHLGPHRYTPDTEIGVRIGCDVS